MGSDSTIHSVVTSLRVLQAFTPTDRVLGVSELARRLGIGKSTVHRALQTLASEGFVTQTTGGRYRLGIKLWELGLQVVHGLELREIAHQHVEALHTRTGETAHVSVLEGVDVVFVDRMESQETLRMFSRVGARVPAHCTSTGKAILAFADEQAVATVVAGGLARMTPRSINSADMLQRALEQVRRDGYAYSLEESEIGVNSVGAPIFDHRNRVIAGVSVAGPISRIRRDRIRELGALVRRVANDVSRELGHRQAASPARPAPGRPAPAAGDTGNRTSTTDNGVVTAGNGAGAGTRAHTTGGPPAGGVLAADRPLGDTGRQGTTRPLIRTTFR